MIQGNDALVTIINYGGEKSIMCVKSFDISLMADTLETTTTGDGKFKSNVYDRYGWTCRLGTVTLLDPNVYTGFDMTEAMLRGDVLELFIRYKEGTRTKIFFGKCIIPVSDIVTTPIDFVHNELELLGTGEFVFINESDVQSMALTVNFGHFYTDLIAISKAYITDSLGANVRLLSSEAWDQNVIIQFEVPKTTNATSFEYEYMPFFEGGIYVTNYTATTLADTYRVKVTFNYDINFLYKEMWVYQGCRIEIDDVLITPLGGNDYEFTVITKNNMPTVGINYRIDGGALLNSPTETFIVNIPTAGAHDILVAARCTNSPETVGVSFTKSFNTSTCLPVGIIGSMALPNGENGNAYTHTKSLSGSAPFTLSVANKPAWMTIAISGNNLNFSGTPTATGTSNVTLTITNCSGGSSTTLNQNITVVTATTGTAIYSVGRDANIAIVCGATPETFYINPIYSAFAIGVTVFEDSAMLTNVGEVYLIHYPSGNLWRTDSSGTIVANMGSC